MCGSIQRAERADIMRNIGDVNAEQIAVAGLFERYGIVQVFGSRTVDGENDAAAQVFAPVRQHLFAGGFFGFFTFFPGELGLHPVFAQNRGIIGLPRVRPAEILFHYRGLSGARESNKEFAAATLPLPARE